MAETTDLVEMEVFRAGDYGGRGAYTEDDLEAMARDYAPETHEAPLTVDHAQSGPALGWVRALRSAGGSLVALVGGIPEAFRAALREGAFKKRSVELVRRHPATGRPYLRAVSLLGAASPAVEGLGEVRFADAPAADDMVRVECVDHVDGDEPVPHPDFPRTVADSCAPDTPGCGTGVPPVQVQPAPPADAPAHSPAPASLCDLAALRAEIEELRRFASDARTDALFAALRREGAPLAAGDEAVLRALVARAEDGVFHFGDIQVDAHAWLSRFLAARPLPVPLGEAAPDAAPPPATVAFCERTDPRSAELHRRAVALIRAEPALAYPAALLRAASEG